MKQNYRLSIFSCKQNTTSVGFLATNARFIRPNNMTAFSPAVYYQKPIGRVTFEISWRQLFS